MYLFFFLFRILIKIYFIFNKQNREKVTNLDVNDNKLENEIKKKNVMSNFKEGEILEDDYILKKYFDKLDFLTSSSDDEKQKKQM